MHVSEVIISQVFAKIKAAALDGKTTLIIPVNSNLMTTYQYDVQNALSRQGFTAQVGQYPDPLHGYQVHAIQVSWL